MPEDEWRYERRGVDAVDLKIVGRVAGVPIVVAANQQDLERPSQAPPAPQLRQCMRGNPPRLGMEEVAENNHPAGAGPLEGAVEPCKVVTRGADRDRDPGRTEGGCLAPVQVGHDQRAGAGPVQGPLTQEIDLLS